MDTNMIPFGSDGIMFEAWEEPQPVIISVVYPTLLLMLDYIKGRVGAPAARRPPGAGRADLSVRAKIKFWHFFPFWIDLKLWNLFIHHTN